MTLYHYEYDSSIEKMSVTPEEFEDVNIKESIYIKRLSGGCQLQTQNIGFCSIDVYLKYGSERDSSCEVTAEMWSTQPDDMNSFKSDIKIHIRKYVNNLLNIFENLSV